MLMIQVGRYLQLKHSSLKVRTLLCCLGKQGSTEIYNWHYYIYETIQVTKILTRDNCNFLQVSTKQVGYLSEKTPLGKYLGVLRLSLGTFLYCRQKSEQLLFYLIISRFKDHATPAKLFFFCVVFHFTTCNLI